MKNIGKIIDNKDIANKKYVDDNSAVEWSVGVDGVIRTNSKGTKANMPAELDFTDKAIINAKAIDLKGSAVLNYGFPIFKGLLGGTFTVKVPKSIGVKPITVKFFKCETTSSSYSKYWWSRISYVPYGNVPFTEFSILHMVPTNGGLVISNQQGASVSVAKIYVEITEDTNNYIYNFTVKDNSENLLIATSGGTAANVWDVDMRFIF